MIIIENLTVTFPGFILSDINLSIQENQFFVLLGPTGSGKTVLLEAIAGLVKTKKGIIKINKKNITDLMPEKRGVSIVYQDYCLFPHLNSMENIKYGLHFHHVDKSEAERRVEFLIDILKIGHVLKRKPSTLSGGELQRVALARSLMIEPKVLLLDEPFSAIDPSFRSELQQLLKKLQRSSKVTFFMVTHSFSEALSLADSAAVLNNGRIEQQGSMMDIFKKPCSTFVADFVGMKNVYPAQFSGNTVKIDNLTIQIGKNVPSKEGYIAIRPEDIVLSKTTFSSSIRNSFKGKVKTVIDKGINYEVQILVYNTIFRSLITRGALIDLSIYEGEEIYISFKATALHVF